MELERRARRSRPIVFLGLGRLSLGAGGGDKDGRESRGKIDSGKMERAGDLWRCYSLACFTVRTFMGPGSHEGKDRMRYFLMALVR